MGHSVTVVCMRRPGQPHIEQNGRLKWVRTCIEIAGKRLPLLALREFRLLFGPHYDIVMERQESFGGACLLVSVLRGIPLLLEVNSPHLAELKWKWETKGRWYLRPVLWLLHAWNLLQFEGSTANIATVPTVVPARARKRTHIVSWGADTEFFKPRPEIGVASGKLKASWGFDGRVVVGFTGSFNLWHGMEQFPKIIENCLRIEPRAAFVVVGGGNLMENISRNISQRGLGHSFKWIRAVPYEQMPLHLSALDVGIAPFFRKFYPPLETHGFFWSPAKIFEYMAAAKPVVSMDIFPLNNIIRHKIEALLAPENDIDTFTANIVELVRNEDLRSRLGAAGMKRVSECYQWRRHVEQLEKIMLDIACPA